jgi:hypothetical protein
MLETMEAPIPVYTAVLLSDGFGVAVRKKMHECVLQLVKSSTTFSKTNNVKNKRRNTTLLEQVKEGRPHCWNRSKKEHHIVGADQISNIEIVETGKIKIHSAQS